MNNNKGSIYKDTSISEEQNSNLASHRFRLLEIKIEAIQSQIDQMDEEAEEQAQKCSKFES